jgi:hypothetical protein
MVDTLTRVDINLSNFSTHARAMKTYTKLMSTRQPSTAKLFQSVT